MFLFVVVGNSCNSKSVLNNFKTMALKLSEDVELIPVSLEIIKSVQGSFRIMQSHLEKLLVVRMLTMLCFQFVGQ